MKTLRQFPGAMPFFIAAFLNAFVDLGHKIVIQNTVYKLYDDDTQVILTAIVNGLILLPFLLLLSPAGFLADKYYKSRVMQMSAWAAVALTLGITACYYLGWFNVAFAMTFLLAAQSAIYSPAKYGFIKDLFGKARLSEANGAISAISIVAILAGSFAYTIGFELLYPENPQNEADILRSIAPVGWLLVISSVIELVLMYRLPAQGETNPKAQFNKSAFFSGRLFWEDLRPLSHSRAIALSVVGLAMFWSIGQVLLAAFPSFLKATTGELNTLKVQAVLACTGIGIAIGSITAGRVSRNYIELGLLPVGALGILTGLIVLTHLQSLLAFAVCFLWIGISGGMFIVPLNALIQFNAKGDALGRTLAANNWVQNLAMLSFLVLTVVFARFGLSSKALLQLMILVALIGCFYTLKQLPQAFVRFVLASVISRRYKVHVQGLQNIPSTGGVLLLGNHISWIDWAILQLASPRPVRFVMLNSIYQRWYLKRFLDLMGCIPIEQGASAQTSIERVAHHLVAGEVVCLFPEGTISRTGHLAEFRKGFERAAALCDTLTLDSEINSTSNHIGESADSENPTALAPVVIIPFYLRGLWGSQFSRASEHFKKSQRRSLSRNLICAFGEPLDKSTSADLLKRRVYDLSLITWQTFIDQKPSLGASWIARAKQVGKQSLLIYPDGSSLSGFEALSLSLLWARRLALHKSTTIAAIIAPCVDAAILHMATFIAGKRIANIDDSQTPIKIAEQLTALDTQVVYILRELPTGLPNHIKAIDMARLKVSAAERALTYLYARCAPAWKIQWLSLKQRSTDAAAVTVFTQDHGINLSHKNIQANIAQLADILNAQADDVVLANLPLHQAYGLTVSLLMPLLQGIACVPQPINNPVADARAISGNEVTLLFADSTMLSNLTAHIKIHPLMLKSLRAVVCSYQGLSKKIGQEFQLKFNIPVLTGFGISEASPVISCNLPDAIDTHNWKVQIGTKEGSQGMPLPGTSIKILSASQQELPSNTVGRVWVAGPQIMLGYIGEEPPIQWFNNNRWLDTQLDGMLDEDGFLTLNS
jgi:acyl-[acyl-carrier-protein]-phospholipid O-acyltransferase/long-chain-fatty-acid--[acyl-carrier-protein] ligase